jgi:hypothetical protein
LSWIYRHYSNCSADRLVSLQSIVGIRHPVLWCLHRLVRINTAIVQTIVLSFVIGRWRDTYIQRRN